MNMADSTVNDVSKMKVVDLRKELKSRGLSHAGDKAELVSRLQAAMSADDHADNILDSDEIDSDGVLEDDDDKSQNDILDDGNDVLNEELALADQHIVEPEKPPTVPKPMRTLKRKITADKAESKAEDLKDAASKKIVLNRNISITSNSITTEPEKEENKKEDSTENAKVKISADIDIRTKLEMRAKRFGLPVKMSEAERKEARKQRFGQSIASSVTTDNKLSGSLSENLDKFKKRAERFGQSVSKIMTDIEMQEKLERRKAKFGTVK